jgi:hypothetical protein
MCRICHAIATTVFVLLCASGPSATAAPAPAFASGIDHGPLTRLLTSHVDAQGLVDYGAWRSHPGDLAALDAYIAHFAAAPPPDGAAEGRELIAGWINLHNALVIRDILRNPSWPSVRRDRGFFTDPRHRCGGAPVSLERLAEGGVIPRMGWRARGLLSLGARGGPPLPTTAAPSRGLDNFLTQQWRHWLKRPGSFEWGPEKIRLPQLFFWHRQEWESEGGWRAILDLDPGVATHDQVADLPVEFLSFDWTLNDTARPAGSYRGWQLLRDRFPW